MENLDNTIKMRLIECFNRNGIEHISPSTEYDSLSFITTVVDIENEFGITFPDELLNADPDDVEDDSEIKKFDPEADTFIDLETLTDIVKHQVLITKIDEHQT